MFLMMLLVSVKSLVCQNYDKTNKTFLLYLTVVHVVLTWEKLWFQSYNTPYPQNGQTHIKKKLLHDF